MTSAAKKKAWDRHWRAGHLSSLSNQNQSAEAPEARAAWDSFFAHLNSGAVILDIATGNGLVPSLMVEHARANDKDFEIVAIDSADIAPEKTVTENAENLEGVLFIGGIEAEELPFEDRLFDALTSQFGLEYTNLDKSVPEAARVLKPGGIIRLVVHAAEGEIVKFNAPKAAQCRYLLSESGIFEALEAAASAKFDNPDALEDTKTALKAALEKTAPELKKMGENPELEVFLKSLLEAFLEPEKFQDFKTFKAWLDETRGDLEDQVLMIEAMAEAALSEEEAGELVEKLGRAGFSRFNLKKMAAGSDKIIGYVIEAVKN